MTGFIDVHTHLHDSRIINDVPDIVLRAKNAGVKKIATCATMQENFERTAELSEKFSGVLPCFGIHPWFLDTLSPNWEDNLAQWLEKIPSGVGETGLDFMDKGADRDLQLGVFKTHLALACDLNRPINIHVRKAWDAILKILKHHGPLAAGGVIHSYSGSADLIPLLEKFNLHISFSGSVTRPNAKKVVQALGAVSLDRIVFETDTPDIVPQFILDAHPDKTPLNEPANVPQIVRVAAQRKCMDFQTLARHGYENSLVLFGSVLNSKAEHK
ncbi:TatD family hydrolase [uncultured Desulfobacter sp.]|uniref:TatD family hydrolase n=1 Tax=uncultured Desulfobacter sp. TaxID=240139 RepID=UPI002AAAD592|nr:TatD family hydrolase [uncultured Desulfobacter sp.]